MNEQLMAGYASYTTADEYSATAVAEAPATTPLLIFASALGFAGAGSYYTNC